MQTIQILKEGMGGYKLLDSGEGKKLEEVGGVRIVRAEPRAWWKKGLSEKEWALAKSSSKNGEWLDEVLDIGIGDIKAKIKFKNTSKHIGIFPEQAGEWKWIEKKIRDSKTEKQKDLGRGEVNVLNLFGYTGIASLTAAKAGLSREGSPKWGAKVTHVDASKPSMDWARDNQMLSGLNEAPIRWILDDVLKFMKREIRKGLRYDAIIMDPPSYGKGPNGEVWKIEEKLPELLDLVRQILSANPLFIIFNMYSTELSSISLANLLRDTTKNLHGSISCGELAIPHHTNPDRLLPMSIFSIWEKN